MLQPLPFCCIIFIQQETIQPLLSLFSCCFTSYITVFRTYCVKPVLTSDGIRLPPTPHPFFPLPLCITIRFQHLCVSNLSMSRINIRIEILLTKAKTLRGEVWSEENSYIAITPSLLLFPHQYSNKILGPSRLSCQFVYCVAHCIQLFTM